MISKKQKFWIADRVNGIDVLALLDKGRITALGLHDTNNPVTVGAILHGRVVGYNKAMGGFDIVCSSLQTPLLMKAPHTAYKGGDTLFFQISAFPQEKEKVPLVSPEIRLIGYHAIYLPFDNKVHYSRKIDKKDKVQIEQDVIPTESGGLILRSGCNQVSGDVINYEIRHLVQKWQSIEQHFAHEDGLADNGLPQTLDVFMQRYETGTPVYASGTFMNGAFHIWMGNHMPHALASHKKENKVYYNNDIDSFIHSLVEKETELSDNISIEVDKTKALTTIDVNASGNKLTSKDIIAICPALAQQIDLRHLTGTILIDFPRFKDKKDKDTIAASMRQAFHPAKDVFHGGFTRLGLYEMAIRHDYPPVKRLIEKILEI